MVAETMAVWLALMLLALRRDLTDLPVTWVSEHLSKRDGTNALTTPSSLKSPIRRDT